VATCAIRSYAPQFRMTPGTARRPDHLERLLPHVRAATDPSRAPDSVRDDITGLLNLAGCICWPGAALGEDHPATVTSASDLARDLPALGQATARRAMVARCGVDETG